MVRVLLTHTPQALANYYGPQALAALQELAEVRLNTSAQPLDTAALVAAAEGCDIVISDRQTPGEAGFFEQAGDVAAFLRCAVDIRNIDVEAASRAGVLVTRATPGFGPAVAELALGFMVDLARGISGCVMAYRQAEKPPVAMGRQLQGASLGIIGYGEIGQRLAKAGLALGMEVLVNDPYKQVQTPGVRQVELDRLLERAEFVVCLAVASPETENLMNAERFARMRPEAFFLNLSRGNLVDEDALVAALDEGRIAGAALDVGRAPDQMPSLKLAHHPRVIATPHIGGLTPAAVAHQAFDTVEQVRAILEGETPAHAVNADRATRLAHFGR